MPDLTQEGLAERGLRVKALEWEHGEGEIVSGDYIVAATFGTWRVWFQGDPLRDHREHPINQVDKATAIASANAHNRARILAALEDTGEPALIREAEARGMERAAEICEGIRTGIANGPMPEGARFDYEQSIRAAAAALRKDEEPK